MRRILVFVIFFTLVFNNAVAFGAEFKDLKGTEYYYSNVERLHSLGVFSGFDDDTFRPNEPLTRASCIVLLLRALQIKVLNGDAFSDCSNHWARNEIFTSLKEGIIVPSEIGDKFNPDEPITRQDMVTMTARALKISPTFEMSPFSDLLVINDSLPLQYLYINSVFNEGLITGIESEGHRYFNPDGYCTRGQFSMILSNAIFYTADKVNFLKRLTSDKENLKAQQIKNNFVEPQIWVNYFLPNKDSYFEVLIKNYDEYSEDYSFKFEVINYPELNTKELKYGDGWHVVNVDSLRAADYLKALRGCIFSLEPRFFTTRENVDKFLRLKTFTIDYVITVKKGSIEKQYKGRATKLLQEMDKQ